LKELIINGKVVKSIWKQDNLNPATENQSVARHRQAYRDPTAKAAIDNVLCEERKANRANKKKQQTTKQNRQGQGD